MSEYEMIEMFCQARVVVSGAISKQFSSARQQVRLGRESRVVVSRALR